MKFNCLTYSLHLLLSIEGVTVFTYLPFFKMTNRNSCTYIYIRYALSLLNTFCVHYRSITGKKPVYLFKFVLTCISPLKPSEDG